MSRKISLAFSPCPNDTFIFDALVNGRIDSKGYSFDVIMEDVEYLNKAAEESRFDITKLSFGVVPLVMETYQLLNSGSALGNACGPLLIAKKHFDLQEVATLRIGIPGRRTTAWLLYQYWVNHIGEVVEMCFSDIEQALIEGHIDIGLIIHESRFTYQDKGLVQLVDLGGYWENASKMPVPLGGIAIKRSSHYNIKKEIDNLIRESILMAIQFPEYALPFIRSNAQEMSDDVMKAHIDLYVN